MPEPPLGPGVTPPFAAPPTEGRSTRLWIGLGVGALALVLCCGGGGAALIGLVVSSTEAVKEQARVVTNNYFGAVRTKNYAKAYSLLCDANQARESPVEFEERISAEPEIAAYKVGVAELLSEIAVDVDVTYVGGGQDTEQVLLAQDGKTGALEVCGIR